MKKHKKAVLIFLFFFTIFSVIAVSYKYYNLILDFTYPAQVFVKNIFDKTNEFFSLIKDKEKLLEENRALKKNQEVLKLEVQKLKFLEYENKKLKSLLNYTKNLDLKDIKLANVIGYPPNSWEKYIVIDAGKKEGVNVGDLVITDGYLVGKITKVGNFSSYVTLVNDLNFKISARTRKTREFVLLEGKGEDGAVLKYVKKFQDIRVGDIVETEQIKGIPIGKIVKVEDNPEEFFKKVKVKPFLKEFSIEYVVVVKVKK